MTWIPLSVRARRKRCFGTLATHILLLLVAIIAINLYLSSLPAWFFVIQVRTRSIAAVLHNLRLHRFATAKFVEERFREFGLSTRTVDYEVLVSYPLKRSLSVVYPSNSSLSLGLDEETVDGDGDSSGVIPTFFAYSPSGEALAEVVYANYGQKSDFDELKSLGVEVRGSVVIARLGKSFRGDIVFNAQEEGAVAVVLYPDPRDYATNATTEGYYPFSRWLPPSGVQRGSVIQDPGDPLTPGWPSSKLSERLNASNLTRLGVPAIPALPISARDALPIIEALGGPVAPDSWQGGLAVDAYRAGKEPVKLDFRYEANLTTATIRNVFGIIEGSEKDRYVLLGNHRDAWTYGAGDPNSGTACLLEIARIFGQFLRRPARTIVFCSWDAEEYSLTGSTEWVEDNLAMLKARAVAYLNVDEAVTGSSFSASATPQLDNLLFDVTKMVKDPDSNGTIFDSWCGKSNDCVGRLGGGGSDYAPFLQHAGIPSTSMTYEEKNSDFPVYHSLYDNYNWMKNFGDPEFHRHATVVKVWGLLARRLVMDTILPFNYVSYANVLEVAVKDLEARFLLISGHPVNILSLSKSRDVNFFPLHFAVDQLRELASKIPSFTAPRSKNDILMLGERCFLDGEGLPGKPWFKHLIYGPTQTNVYGTSTFPAIADVISKMAVGEDKEELKALKQDLQHEIWRASRAVQCAANVLKGDIFS
ncbi:probable glutamate carboxypeptidase LAMP1 [Selaginella moellendorffii]|uniref:probable glutamate carboxypeptidase LAMP1 n=1 Tax=Selaginella moellendorffii TaxID=88036 RepID=UPI000D1C3B20|nr:probable glutamate carboxypeptidase LAMP1 [Selaginella moellendorffii]|eukprot:XP_024527494.1 probable glutamate carboxypeptidase LAMP1 [Selaginella moellendorffii]